MVAENIEKTELVKVSDFVTIKDVINQTLAKNNIVETEIVLSNSIPSGYKQIDKLTTGFQNGELTTIVVKQGMGKTAFLLSLINNISVKYNKKVAIFSSERSAQKIVNRMIETETGVSIDKYLGNKLKDSEKDHVSSMINALSKAAIYIDDTPNLSMDEFVKRSQELKNTGKVEAILIDYLELLTTSILDKDERAVQLANIVNIIKNAAKELNIPIILFSQISNNNVIDCKSDIPVYVNNNCNNVMYLCRSKNNTTEKDGVCCDKDLVELIIAKHPKIDEPKVVPLKFIESIDKFVDIH